MGGELTWQCQGGNYVFTLVFYRDCNGAEVNTISENIRVWNHPTITSLTLPFVNRIDISPTCNPVAGSPVPLDCGVGNNGGNGVGAIEKITYRSAPITLLGTPGANGWIFTYENFSRSNSLTNISNPSTYGITLAAKMYAVPGAATGCIDNSPIFLQEPYFVSCAGTPYQYNMNAVDPDLDSLFVSFGVPYNNFPSGIYDPPNSPVAVPFEPGFSFTNPTPGPAINPSNVAAQIDPSSGQLTFESSTTGNYVVKASIKSYRNGVLIAEVEREMQLVVVGCAGANNPPIINAPFGGGLLASANIQYAKLFRYTENLQLQIDLYLPPYLAGKSCFTFQPGDSLVFKEIHELSQNRVKISGAVLFPGFYGLDSSKTVLSLFKKAIFTEDASKDQFILLRKDENGALGIKKMSLKASDGFVDVELRAGDEVIIDFKSKFISC
jgi:hypothetical protein